MILPQDCFEQAGYVANRGVDIPQALNLNAAQFGGGEEALHVLA